MDNGKVIGRKESARLWLLGLTGDAEEGTERSQRMGGAAGRDLG